MQGANGDFSKWQNLILSDLKRLDLSQEKLTNSLDQKLELIHKEINSLRVDLAVLRAKAITWGSISGGAGAGLLMLLNALLS